MKTGKSVLAIMVQVFFISSILFFFSGAAMAECPGFTKVTGTANWFEGKTIGTEGMNSPALVDINGDNKLDVFVGSLDGKIYYFQNTTTDPVSPSFDDKASNPLASISFPVGTVLKPCFAKIKDDENNEKTVLFLSVSGESYVKYYEYNGTSFVENDAANPFNGKVIDATSSFNAFKPAFADIDGDGDMDALFGMERETGDFYAKIKYYKNIGVNVFEEQSDENNPFNEIRMAFNPTPEVVNGKHLIVGDKNKINYYKNTGSLLLPEYDDGCSIEAVSGNFYYPAFGDLFGNGEMKVLVGTASKIGLEYWNYSDVIPVVPGDIDGKNGLTLADAILGLKILAAADISGEINLNADINADQKIGQEEVIFVLREVAQIE